MTAIELAATAYVATLLCVLIVEIAPMSRFATRAAIASLIFALTGSSAWCYAAFFEPGQWPDFAIARHDADRGHGSSRRSAAATGDNAGEFDEGAGGRSGGAGRGRNDGTGTTHGGGEVPDANSFTAARRRWLARALGYAGGDGDDLAPFNGEIRDCETCPVLLIVPAGSARIGADDDDAAAEAAERPARSVRIWPGFAISQRAIDLATYEQFRIETGRGRETCQADTASITQDATSDELATADGRPDAPVTCVTPQAAESFATWLSLRTGKRYRLPSAIEWEYAAKMLPAPGMKTSDVAEIVGDCWQHHLPRAGFELIAVQARGTDCMGRMLKGGSPRHPSAWHRPSARHELAAARGDPDAGFRVMRALD